jgi:glutamate 5-kinase
MQLYQSAFDAYSVRTAQLLLTAGDFDHRGRYLNVRNTLRTLFQYGCLPIINENDTVSTAEIKFGDNDQLAAMTANLLQAPLLILLTNVDGLYTADPRVDPHATLQTLVPKIDGRVAGLAAETKSGLGTGGMKSKLKAARLATAAGAAVLMANGSHEAILDRIFAGEPVGTFFMPQAAKVSARKRWLGFTARPRGELTLDPGAVRALLAQGKSLLPVGVRAVSGQFQKGDLLILRDPQGREFARGLTHYNSTQIQAMLGRTTAAIQQSLGVCPYPELIHRDHLVITDADWLLEAESAVKVLEHANVSQPTPGAGGV